MSKKNKLVVFRAVREAVSMEQILTHYGLLEAMKRSGDNLSRIYQLESGIRWGPARDRRRFSLPFWSTLSATHPLFRRGPLKCL